MSARLVAVLALAALAACKGPAVPNPAVGQPRFLCCNMFYEKPKINDTNYQRGTMIPFGTRVDIQEVRKNRVRFQPAGHPPIDLVLTHGKKTLTMDQYIDRIFVASDPHTKLRRTAESGGRGGKSRDKTRDKGDGGDVARINAAIEHAQVVPGMTRDEVLMAIGYPPAHRTPSLESSTWTYWANRWESFMVNFDGNRVAGVTR
jgi:hypothetical protein